jgi:hypothetical protein
LPGGELVPPFPPDPAQPPVLAVDVDVVVVVVVGSAADAGPLLPLSVQGGDDEDGDEDGWMV